VRRDSRKAEWREGERRGYAASGEVADEKGVREGGGTWKGEEEAG